MWTWDVVVEIEKREEIMGGWGSKKIIRFRQGRFKHISDLRSKSYVALSF